MPRPSSFHPNKFFVLVTKLLLVFLLAAMNLNSTPIRAESASSQDYIIKFTGQNGINTLKNLGSNIQARLQFSKDPKFQNIYTFTSNLPQPQLEKYLAGQFEYLQTQNQFSVQVAVNDPGFTTNPDNVDKQWGLVKANILDAWAKTTGTKDAIIALIDTGVDATHEDLQTINFVPGFNFLTHQEIRGNFDSDDNGHGTLIAGVLGATADNNVGIAGIERQISIMPIKALDAQGKGEAANVSEAIVWATDHGASIINLSLGGIGFGRDATLANAISYAFYKNVLIVAAAGNDAAATGKNLDTEPVYPICDDNNVNMIVGVAATDHNDQKAQFSNYGKNCIDVSAPGKRILSTINSDPLTKTAAPNSYAYASGTSLAVPFVAGQAALIKSLYPKLDNTQIRDLIISTADPVDNMNLAQCEGVSCSGLIGKGRINVKKSIDAAANVQFTIQDGDVVRVEGSYLTYQISGGQKRPISPFVYNQYYLGTKIKTVAGAELANFPEGSYEPPLDNTLIKLDNDPAVYMMQKGFKLPITYQVFTQRKMNFADINIVSFPEFNSWLTGSFLPPVEGTLIKAAKNSTVYWVINGSLHPMNYAFYKDRGLDRFPILTVSSGDMASFPKGEAFIR